MHIYRDYLIMKRRSFIKNISTGIGSLALLPGLTPEIPDRLSGFAEELSVMSTPDDLWKRVRKEFQFNPGVVHFNSATLGATPRMVLDADSR